MAIHWSENEYVFLSINDDDNNKTRWYACIIIIFIDYLDVILSN